MSERERLLVQVWEIIEDDDPDISTERLMEMVCQTAKADANEVAEALEAEAIESQTVVLLVGGGAALKLPTDSEKLEALAKLLDGDKPDYSVFASYLRSLAARLKAAKQILGCNQETQNTPTEE